MRFSSFGKLTLLNEGGPEQEFELRKTAVTFGRATTSDIVLNDARVSRSHARLEFGPSGATIVDLGSSNGTRLNGTRVERAELKPGDILSLGSTRLRYEISAPSEEAGLTMIETDVDLNLAIDREVLPVAIQETGIPRLVIFTPEKTWDVPLDRTDNLKIGRDEGNQVVIEGPNVSRRHAEITRKGDQFFLHDLGSTNGTWFGDERVDQLHLQNGTTFRIGQGQLVFKSGFSQESLTIADGTFIKQPKRYPVIFIPGMMGSELWLGNERIWPNVKILFKNPEIFRYPSKIPLEPRGIVDEIVIVPNLIKQDQYNRLGDYLVEELGYQRGVDFFEFAYDWRQDVRLSARQLGQLIETISAAQPITIIAHSLGTMVGRYYIEHLGGAKRVGRAILMGGPHQGAVRGLASILVAPEVLPFGLMGERLRQIALTFPSNYQTIATYACGVDQNGRKINFLEDESWLSEEYRPLLREARKFRQELGRLCSIPTLSIFGYGLKTMSGVTLKRDSQGKISDVVYKIEANGDDTIPERSAALTERDIHPVQQHHGSLFVDNDVKMRLKVELARQFSI